MKFSTILMDVDGTLLDFDAAERLSVRTVMEHYGVTPTRYLEQRYHEINKKYWKSFERGEIPKEGIFEKRFVEFFGTLGITVDDQEAEGLYRRELDTHAILIDGALELCQYLKERYHLYIVTNGVSSTQYCRLRLSTLDQYFEDIFVSEDIGSQKPQKEYFTHCFSRIPEKDRSRILIVGDSLTSDIQGGIHAGIATCWVNLDKQRRMAGVKADYEVERLEELKKIL